MANLLYLVDSEHATTWYRTKIIAKKLKEFGHEAITENKFNQDMLNWCDILIIQRTNQDQIKEAVKYVNARGKLTVLDLDDDYWNMHNTNPAWKSWQEPGVLFDFSNIVREVRRCTTTTPALRTLLLQFNKDVRIVPNSLPDEYWMDVPLDPRDHDDIVVGWAGSTSHYYDMKEVIPIFSQILNQYPNIRIEVAGTGPQWFPPLPRLFVIEARPIETYPTLLTRFDIGLAPLRDLKFNESKSNLKWLEYSAAGVPTVASKTITYTPYIKNGINGYLAKNTKDWLKYVDMLIENPDLRQSIKENAQKEVRENYMLSNVIHQWMKAYDL